MSMLPTVTLISDSGGPHPNRRYRFVGGDLAPEWAESLRPGREAWCEVSIYGESEYLSSYGGEVWPGAWPALFVCGREYGNPTTRVTAQCVDLLRAARDATEGAVGVA